MGSNDTLFMSVSPNKPKAWLKVRKILAVGAMLSLWLVTYGLSFSPDFHRLLHKDAQSANHQCAVTHIQQTSLLPALTAAVEPVVSAVETWVVPCSEFEFLPSFSYRLSHSRAPPAV